MFKDNSGKVYGHGCQRRPESLLSRQCLSISAILISIVLLMLLAFPIASGAYYSGQLYTFSSTPENEAEWDYLWTAFPAPLSSFVGGINNKATVQWIAPYVTEPTDYTIAVTVSDKVLPSCLYFDNVAITVDPLAGLTICKDSVPNDPQDFGFTVESEDLQFSEAFSLDDDGDTELQSCELFDNILPGTYIISESAFPDWDLSKIDVIGGSSIEYSATGLPGSWDSEFSAGDRYVKLAIGSGEGVRITYTNVKQSKIQVDKVTAPTGDIQVFTFTGDLGEIQLADPDPVFESPLLSQGDYIIGENDQADWTLANILVEGAKSFNFSADGIANWHGTFAAGDRFVNVTTDPGQIAKVTFFNDKMIHLLISKVALPAGEAGDTQFWFSSDDFGPFFLLDGGTKDSGPLSEGTYVIGEDPIEGWDLTDILVEDTSGIDEAVTFEFSADGQTDWHPEFVPDSDRYVRVTIKSGAIPQVTFANTQEQEEEEGELVITKVSDVSSVHQGQEIHYTITVCNEGTAPIFDVVARDVFARELPPSAITAISPAPSADGKWHIGQLDPGECAKIFITVTVPLQETRFDMEQGVSGTGFVNVQNDYDTTFEPYVIKNCAYATAEGFDQVSSCVSVTVLEEQGTEVIKRQAGSGTYDSEEVVQYRTLNKSIEHSTELSASYAPTTFWLPNKRSINYSTRWIDKTKSRNKATGAAVTEEYTYADSIDRESSHKLDENGSLIDTSVEFTGVGYIGTRKTAPPGAPPKHGELPYFDGSEDYVGSFETEEHIDDYGTSVKINRSTTGYGYVAVDRKVKDSQRSYEYGTGSYESEEVLETPTNYMAKDLRAVHGATNFTYSPNFRADQNIKWNEGMESVSRAKKQGVSASYIGERYSDLSYIDKETEALGLNEMRTEAQFQGTADYRALAYAANGSMTVDDDERYMGDYEISRHVWLTGTAKYDAPHLTVSKEGELRQNWYHGVNSTLVEYQITVTNDGNQGLAPVLVQDLFPPGTQFINSTIRPSIQTNRLANWTLSQLAVGESLTIGLTLNVTDDASVNLVNRVHAAGAYGDQWVCASNYSAIESSWLTCCPPMVTLDKEVWADPADPGLVHYRLKIDNQADSAVSATIIDLLPSSMRLAESSIDPSSYRLGQITWVLPEIAAKKTVYIEYTAGATRSGSYSNTAYLEAVYIVGTGSSQDLDTADIAVNSSSTTLRSYRYGAWEPPQWMPRPSQEGLNLYPG